MTIQTFPSLRGGLGPAGGMSWRKLSNTQVFESPLTRSVQTVALPGARWACTATWQNLTADEAALFRAFLYGLRGRAGRFRLPHFGRRAPLSAISGTPLVAGAGQTGATLETDGWSPGVTLAAGEFMQVGDELRVTVQASTASSGGAMSIVLDEPLRSSPADNAPLVFNLPAAVMMLRSDDVESSFARSVLGPLESFTLDCVETWS